jgi:hypothetical protein
MNKLEQGFVILLCLSVDSSVPFTSYVFGAAHSSLAFSFFVMGEVETASGARILEILDDCYRFWLEMLQWI